MFDEMDLLRDSRNLQREDSLLLKYSQNLGRKYFLSFGCFQSYRDYHADIFPDTTGLSSAMGPADWFENRLDAAAPKISLDPKKRPREVLTVFQVR